MASDAITSNPMQDIPTKANANISRRLNRMLGLSLHSWEDIMVASLALAGVIALIIGVATFSVVRLQRIEIAESIEALERYKIGSERAMESVKSEAARANESSEHLRNDTARLQSENLALQTVLLPRRVPLSSTSFPNNADVWFAPLSGFNMVPFAIQPVNDAEARSLAEDISIGLAFVGVTADIDEGAAKLNPTNVAEGVTVSFPEGNAVFEKAANLLADALTKAGLGVGDMTVFRHSVLVLDPKDIASGLVNPIHSGVVVAIGQRPISQTVVWLKRKAGEAPAATIPDAK